MLNFSALRTPEGDAEVLVDPPPDRWRGIVRDNQQRLDHCSAPVLDRTIAQVRRDLRGQRGSGPTILTGHQPEPIHPGVWAKNVVTFRAARHLDGTAINLVADTDHPKRLALPVPSHEDGPVRLELVPIADGPPDWAYESLPPSRRVLLDELDRVARRQLGDHFVRSLMVEALGTLRTDGSDNLAGQWSAARRAVEAHFGIAVNDVYVSRLAAGDAFLAFAADLVSKAKRLAAAYNASTAEYRKKYGVRSAGRPVPDLLLQDDMVELPLWYCPARGPRARLFIRTCGNGGLELRTDREPLGCIAADELRNWGQAVDAMRRAGQGRIRPRALTLTLFGRLIYGDLFVHGIGGAKYDRVTDGICRRFYGIEPPVMACVTATLRLPLPLRRIEQSPQQLHHKLRDLRFNPQRYLAEAGSAETETGGLLDQRGELIRQAQRLRRNEPTNRPQRRRVWRQIRDRNARLVGLLGDLPDRLRRQLDQIEGDLRHNQIAAGREYYFALYPERKLQVLLDALPQPGDFG